MDYNHFFRVMDLASDLLISLAKVAREQNIPLKAFYFLTKEEGEETTRQMIAQLKNDYFKSFIKGLPIWETVVNREISLELLSSYRHYGLNENGLDFGDQGADLSENGTNELVVVTPTDIGFWSEEQPPTFEQVFHFAISNMGLALCSTKLALSLASSNGWAMELEPGPYAYLAMVPINKGRQDGDYSYVFGVDSKDYQGRKKLHLCNAAPHNNLSHHDKLIFVRPKVEQDPFPEIPHVSSDELIKSPIFSSKNKR